MPATKVLVVGRGAMGILWGSSIHSPALPVSFIDAPNLPLDFTLGIIPAPDSSTIITGLPCPTISQSDLPAYLTPSTIVFVCVKAHQITQALQPIVSVSQSSMPYIILLHNGLPSRKTTEFLSSHAPHAYSMVTSRGATLLQRSEIPPPYSIVARATGPGPSFLFPNSPNAIQTLPEAFTATLPDTVLLPHASGLCEQILKLAVNVALNGTLAYLSLQSTPPRRIVNFEMSSHLDLAVDVARLVLHRAYLKAPNEHLGAAIGSDLAASRTRETMAKVPQNVCSTVVDITNGRQTEREALLDAVMGWGVAEEETDDARLFLEEIHAALLKHDAHVDDIEQWARI